MVRSGFSPKIGANNFCNCCKEKGRHFHILTGKEYYELKNQGININCLFYMCTDIYKNQQLKTNEFEIIAQKMSINYVLYVHDNISIDNSNKCLVCENYDYEKKFGKHYHLCNIIKTERRIDFTRIFQQINTARERCIYLRN
jgi:hypothetical protein